ncbi:MAG: sigma-70 family RNA polymerase sigma factor [Thermoanaerobaculia bacterium]
MQGRPQSQHPDSSRSLSGTAGIAGSVDAVAQLAELFREHYDKVFRAAHRITGNAMDAEDVLQSVFLRLARRQEASPLGAEAAGYFYRSAVNAALDVVRARNRAGWAPLEEAELPRAAIRALAGAEFEPERDRRLKQLRKTLRLAVARLSPRAALVFSLRYFEGLGNQEIAEIVGSSQGVVAVLLHRTRFRLRKELTRMMGEAS